MYRTNHNIPQHLAKARRTSFRQKSIQRINPHPKRNLKILIEKKLEAQQKKQ